MGQESYPVGADLGHLFVNQDTPLDNDYMDINSDSTAQDNSIYQKEKADFGKQIDRDAMGIGQKEDLDPKDNPGQSADYEYKGAAVKGSILLASKRQLEGSRVLLEHRTAGFRAEGTIVADHRDVFAVLWNDSPRRVTIEEKANYSLFQPRQ